MDCLAYDSLCKNTLLLEKISLGIEYLKFDTVTTKTTLNSLIVDQKNFVSKEDFDKLEERFQNIETIIQLIITENQNLNIKNKELKNCVNKLRQELKNNTYVNQTEETVESSSKLKTKYSISIVPINEIKILDDDELKKLINSVGSLTSHYKGIKDKKPVYNTLRTNLNNLQNENKSRKQIYIILESNSKSNNK
jgi:hypothetical protein